MPRSKKTLKIKCTDSDCGSGLHCFKATDEMLAKQNVGPCRQCGAQLIDWERIHSRDLRDAHNTLAMLKMEKVRHFFWHLPLSERAINHARRKGKSGIRERVRSHLSSAIGPAHPWHDGFQTPMQKDESTALPYAQHATATCCRDCLDYWHGIPKGEALSDAELDYLTELMCLYIEDRIPTLTENGEYIPPIRRTN
jgi:hypothetical protein